MLQKLPGPRTHASPKQRKPRLVGITLVLTLHFPASPAARRVSIVPTCAIIVLRQSQILRLAVNVGESSFTDLTPAQQLRDTSCSSPITYGTHIPNAVCATPQSDFVCPSTATAAAITKVMAITIHNGEEEQDIVNEEISMTHHLNWLCAHIGRGKKNLAGAVGGDWRGCSHQGSIKMKMSWKQVKHRYHSPSPKLVVGLTSLSHVETILNLRQFRFTSLIWVPMGALIDSNWYRLVYLKKSSLIWHLAGLILAGYGS